MKRAFTLIELLVVIAIIAILAAILFPVFTQAKLAAKKTASISNQKQIGTAVMIYMSNYDDMFPRNDDCIDKSSLNASLNSTAFNLAACIGAGPYMYRMNHYAWQKWVMPYTKNVDLFMHPVVDHKQFSNWGTHGELMGSYAINLALTGALNTANPATTSNRFRDSFIGGTATGVSTPGEAMLLMELVDPTVNFAPVFLDGTGATDRKTAYPFAIREAWEVKFYPTNSSCVVTTRKPDAARVPFAEQINLSFVDGHTKGMPVAQFLANTPTAAEYVVSSRPACGLGSGSWTAAAAPTWTKPWPMWALQ